MSRKKIDACTLWQEIWKQMHLGTSPLAIVFVMAELFLEVFFHELVLYVLDGPSEMSCAISILLLLEMIEVAQILGPMLTVACVEYVLLECVAVGVL